jgi:ribosomal protein RSM22 (predicted rRNA methylase)
VDTSGEMGEMARLLRQAEEEEEGGRETITGVYFRQYLPTSNKVQYDLVTSCYALGDIASHGIKKLSLAALWRKTKSYLVLVELGNDTGFRNILEARDMILDAPNWITNDSASSSTDHDIEDTLEGHVFAPCPHSHRCPLMTAASATDEGATKATMGGPCRFGQRVALDLSNREILKHKGHNIEAFSYVILKKGRHNPSNEQYSRLLSPVKKRSRHILTQQCCPDGSVRQVIYTKSKDGTMYRLGREGSWGDMLPYSQDGENSDTHTPAAD